MRGFLTRISHLKKGSKGPTQQKLRGFNDLWRLVFPKNVGEFGTLKFFKKIFNFLFIIKNVSSPLKFQKFNLTPMMRNKLTKARRLAAPGKTKFTVLRISRPR